MRKEGVRFPCGSPILLPANSSPLTPAYRRQQRIPLDDRTVGFLCCQLCCSQLSAMSRPQAPSDRQDVVPRTVFDEHRHGLEPESYTSKRLVRAYE